MANCDICSSSIGDETTCFLLNTREIVTSESGWFFTLSQLKMLKPEMNIDADALVRLVAMRASQDSPWLVCKECVIKFDCAKNRARELAKKWLQSSQSFEGNSLCDISDDGNFLVTCLDDEGMQAAIAAATNAWESLYGNTLESSDAFTKTAPVAKNIKRKSSKHLSKAWWQFWRAS